MTHWGSLAGTAVVLFASASWIAPLPSQRITDLARPLAAPLVLPFAWSGVTAAARRSPQEMAARSRLVLELLPPWRDGYVYVAHVIAFQRAGGADPDAAIDDLLAACDLLESARQRCPQDEVQLLLSQALLIELRAQPEPATAARYAERTGQSPLEAAEQLLVRAERIDARFGLREERAFLTRRMVGLALRDGAIDRARTILRRAIELFRELEHDAAADSPARDHLAAHRGALERLEHHLDGDAGFGLTELRADPLLEDLVSELLHH